MRRRSTRVAWSMLAIFVVGWTIMSMLAVANGNVQNPADSLALLLAFGGFMIVGALIVAHRPENAIGWIFSAIGLLAATGGLAQEYAQYAYLTRPGSLPVAVLLAWYASWWWYPTITLALVFILLLFPTGRPLSPRWRPVAVVAAIVTTALAALTALQPTLTLRDTDYAVENPIGLAGIQNPEQSTVHAVLFGLLLGCMVAAGLSMVLRFRRSRGVERQQLKWFTYAAALLILWGLLTEFLFPNASLDAVFGLLLAFVPVAAGVAILRYRLYDIDRLINRTLVYGLLTALLAGVYAGVVLVLGQAFGGLGAEPPSWAVAGATLAVAAVFQPARRRIQQAVDRRFDRRRYDAAKTIDAFSARLREEIDLDTLSAELLAVVNQTMQPTRVSLWLRPAAHGSWGTSRSAAGPASRADRAG